MKGIIFDLDGTLLDSDEAVFMLFNDILKRFGFKERSMKEVMSYRGNTTERWIKQLLPEISGEELGMMGRYGRMRYASWFLPKYGKEMAGAGKILRYLKEKGMKIAVVTNQVKEEVEKSLEVIGFRDFDVVVSSENIKNPKPDPDSIEYCIKKMNLRKKDVVLVGDSKIDFETGKNAGVEVILLKNRYNSDLKCKKISSLEELKDLIF